MDVKCPKCGTINTLDDDVVTESGTRISCAGCGVKLVVKKKIKKTSSAPPPPPISEPPSLKLTEEEGFYMPDEGLKRSLESEQTPKEIDEQFFDAGFSLGGDAESSNVSLGLDFPGAGDLKEEFPQEEIFKGPSPLSEEKPAEEELSGFDMLTESLFAGEEVVETPIPAEEPPKPPQTAKPSSVIKKIPVKKVSAGRKEERRGIGPLFGILFLVVLGAGLFYWKGKEVATFFHRVAENSNFDIKIINQRFLVSKRGERVYVIVGKVRPKEIVVDSIKLKAVLYDENGFEKSSIELYAGNILKEDELRELSPFAVYERLQNEVGEMFSNLNVTPEKGVDFMAVFYDPPQGRVQIQVVDYRKK